MATSLSTQSVQSILSQRRTHPQHPCRCNWLTGASLSKQGTFYPAKLLQLQVPILPQLLRRWSDLRNQYFRAWALWVMRCEHDCFNDLPMQSRRIGGKKDWSLAGWPALTDMSTNSSGVQGVPQIWSCQSSLVLVSSAFKFNVCKNSPEKAIVAWSPNFSENIIAWLSKKPVLSSKTFTSWRGLPVSSMSDPPFIGEEMCSIARSRDPLGSHWLGFCTSNTSSVFCSLQSWKFWHTGLGSLNFETLFVCTYQWWRKSGWPWLLSNGCSNLLQCLQRAWLHLFQCICQRGDTTAEQHTGKNNCNQTRKSHWISSLISCREPIGCVQSPSGVLMSATLSWAHCRHSQNQSTVLTWMENWIHGKVCNVRPKSCGPK